MVLVKMVKLVGVQVSFLVLVVENCLELMYKLTYIIGVSIVKGGEVGGGRGHILCIGCCNG